MIEAITDEVSDLLACDKLNAQEYNYVEEIIEQEESYTEEQREIIEDLHKHYCS